MFAGRPPQGQERRANERLGDGLLPLDQLRPDLTGRNGKVADGAIASGHQFRQIRFWDIPIPHPIEPPGPGIDLTLRARDQVT